MKRVDEDPYRWLPLLATGVILLLFLVIRKMTHV